MDLFLWPWIAVILPLPFLVRWLSRRLQPRKATYILDALYVPFFDRIAPLGRTGVTLTGRVGGLFLTIAWICLVLAGMRPIRYETDLPSAHEARNLMLAIDLSGSMAEKDFEIDGIAVTRIQVVKEVVRDFIAKRGGDRLGLIVFGTSAHTLAPLSLDMKTLDELFEDVDLGIAGEKTAIGDALALAVQDTAKVPEGKKAVILLSDGFNTAGTIKISQAIELAKKQKIAVYTIGIGTTKKKTDIWGMLAGQTASWDEQTLRRIAKETGGRYFSAESAADLKSVYRQIDLLETSDVDGVSVRPRRDLFYWPLSVCLVFWFLAQYRRRAR